MKKLLLLAFAIMTFSSLSAQDACFAGTFPQTLGSQPRPYIYTTVLNGDGADESTGDTTLTQMVDEAVYDGDTIGFLFTNETLIPGEASHPIVAVALDTIIGLPDGLTFGFVSGNAQDNPQSGVRAYSNANPQILSFTDQTGSADEGPYFCGALTGTPDMEDPSPTTGPDTVMMSFGLVFTLDMPNAPSGGFTDTVNIAYSIIFPEVVSRNESAPLQALNLSPNPATDELNVRFNTAHAHDVRFEVYDLQGRLLQAQDASQMQAGAHTQRLNISELPAGVYLLQSTADGVRQTQKFVKH